MTVQSTSQAAYHAHKSSGKLGTQLQQILDAFQEGNDYSLQEITQITGIGINAVSGGANNLKKKGLIEVVRQRPCSVTGNTIGALRLTTAETAQAIRQEALAAAGAAATEAVAALEKARLTAVAAIRKAATAEEAALGPRAPQTVEEINAAIQARANGSAPQSPEVLASIAKARAKAAKKTQFKPNNARKAYA